MKGNLVIHLNYRVEGVVIININKLLVVVFGLLLAVVLLSGCCGTHLNSSYPPAKTLDDFFSAYENMNESKLKHSLSPQGSIEVTTYTEGETPSTTTYDNRDGLVNNISSEWSDVDFTVETSNINTSKSGDTATINGRMKMDVSDYNKIYKYDIKFNFIRIDGLWYIESYTMILTETI